MVWVVCLVWVDFKLLCEVVIGKIIYKGKKLLQSFLFFVCVFFSYLFFTFLLVPPLFSFFSVGKKQKTKQKKKLMTCQPILFFEVKN